MKTHITVLAVLSLTIAGCDNKSDFEKAIAQNLKANGNLCLGIKKWPVDITIFEIRSKSRKALTFANLQIEGMVNGEDVMIANQPWKVPAARYTPTEQAKPFMAGPDICWGEKVLSEVVKWDGPKSNGDYKEAVVTYSYGVKIAPWLLQSSLPNYYPEMNQAKLGPQQARATLKLTSAGWEVK